VILDEDVSAPWGGTRKRLRFSGTNEGRGYRENRSIHRHRQGPS
jgi:hypothetical protein